MKKLFLDDIRNPPEAIGLVSLELEQIYLQGDWCIVRSYFDFCKSIQKSGLPDLISFDHDLADDRYKLYPDDSYTEKTGYECAKWLVDWCLENNKQLPKFVVHSANPVGKKNIEMYLNNATKHLLKDV